MAGRRLWLQTVLWVGILQAGRLQGGFHTDLVNTLKTGFS